MSLSVIWKSFVAWPRSAKSVTIGLTLLIGLTFTACGADVDDKKTSQLPNVVGMTLDKAKGSLKEEGFKKVKAVDRKESRHIIVDSNWIVVDQSPSASDSIAIGTEITLGVVKESENTTTTTTSSTTTTTEVPTTTTTITTLPTTVVAPAPSGSASASSGGSTSNGSSSGSTSVYYANCSAARSAGAAPLYRGEPGYRSGLDRDDDGIACE